MNHCMLSFGEVRVKPHLLACMNRRAYMKYKLLESPGCPYCHLELIPGVWKSQFNVGGLFHLLEGILYWILLRNVSYWGILPSNATFTLNPLKPFGKSLCRGHGSKILS